MLSVWSWHNDSLNGMWRSSGPANVGIRCLAYGPSSPHPSIWRLHIAFSVDFDQLLAAPDYLRRNGVTPLGFDGEKEIDEPVVFPWMPAASVYFKDPDGHSLEYIAFLGGEAKPQIPRVLSWSEWKTI